MAFGLKFLLTGINEEPSTTVNVLDRGCGCARRGRRAEARRGSRSRDGLIHILVDVIPQSTTAAIQINLMKQL